MRDALKEIGIRKAIRYVIGQLQISVLKSELLLTPFRGALLALFGAKIGSQCVIHASTFFNAYRTGFQGLTLGDHCFIGNDCLIDLADRVTFGSHVTIAERVTILTHTNMGFKDHPLQAKLPAFQKPVVLMSGCFVGVNVTILPGVTIGERAIVGAGALVREDVAADTTVAGVPARVIGA